jgi:exonuclease-1
MQMLTMLLFRSRKENLERAREHEAAGNSRAAYQCYQKAVDITPKIASELIQVQMQIPFNVTSYLFEAAFTRTRMFIWLDLCILL